MKKVTNLIFGVTILALGLAGCSSGSDSSDSAPVSNASPVKPVSPEDSNPSMVDIELISAQDALQSMVEKAAVFAEKAVEGENIGEYAEGAIASLYESIEKAKTFLGSEDKTALKSQRLALASALVQFFSQKNLPTWNLIFEKGADGDQSRIRIQWEDDADALTLDAVAGFESFVIDGNPAHIYWPDTANLLDSENKSVQWAPAFTGEEFAEGFHELKFRFIRESGDETEKWDVTFDYDLDKNAVEDDVISPIFMDITLYKPTVADLLLELEPIVSGAKESLEKAEEGNGLGEYEPGAKDELNEAISLAEAVRNASQPSEVEEAIKNLLAAVDEFAMKKNVPHWSFKFSRLEGTDQTKIEISWNEDEDALSEEAIQKVNDSFVLDGKAANGFWAADGITSGVDEGSKTLFYKPLFNDFYVSGEHVLTFGIKQPLKDGEKHPNDWVITLKYNPSSTVQMNTAFTLTYTDISYVKHDWAAEAKKSLEDAVAKAEDFADRASSTSSETDNVYYADSDIAAFKDAIEEAKDLLVNDSTSEDDVEAEIESLSMAVATLKNAKKIKMWSVELLRRTNDQTTVTISWQDSTYKLTDARNAVVDSDNGHSFRAFRIDDVVSHTYYPDGNEDFVTADSYISLKPAFHEPSLLNGSHTLYFNLVAGEGDNAEEYEIEVPFTLSGNSNTDECEAEIDTVKVSKLAPEVKAARQLQKAKDELQAQIDEALILAGNADASKYEDGAVDALNAAISTAKAAKNTAETVDSVKSAESALENAVAAFHVSEKIENWKVEIRQHDGDQYTVVVSWAKAEFAINLSSVSEGNATFVTDGKASHTYWPAENNKEEPNRVIFNPANNQVAGADALGEHQLVFDLKPIGSDTVYDITVDYRLNENNSWAEIISTKVTEKSGE
ncbi:MAG: FIVAR domain-containing protein [Treponema sp.]|uniref:hypothetical protein n=1 Tax=Treponema sp. TaxID=166 RepID=UPI0025F79CB9|nr:hypothetical protein [Treponema sp.]MBQ9280586.1 FIVAR domain-containing protein [Treponema sp.]